MELKSRIQEDMKTAMRAQEKDRLSVIRLIMAALKQVEVDQRITLSDADVIGILDKMLKQRRESIIQYEKGNRQDLADREKYEITIIEAYMPAGLAAAEIEAFIREAIVACEAKTLQDMGKVMAWLRPKLQWRADMGQVSAKIKEKLSG